MKVIGKPEAKPQIGITFAGPLRGKPIVLVHGLGSCALEMRLTLEPRLIRSGYQVISVDRPGYGASAGLSGCGPMEQAAHIRARLKDVLSGPAVLVAHSFGAATALHLALSAPELLSGLVLVAPFCKPTPPAFSPLLRLAVLPYLGKIVRRYVAARRAKALLDSCLVQSAFPDPPPSRLRRLEPRLFVTDEAIMAMAAELRAFNRQMAEASRNLQAIKAPVVVVAGWSDGIVDCEAHSLWLRTRLPAARHFAVDGGHLLHHTQPDYIEGAIELLAA